MIDDEERRARLAGQHRLLPERRIDDITVIADDLVALHSTDPVTVYLSAMARMVQPSLQAVERPVYTDRSLIRHHAMRRTLWLATPEVARAMHAAATLKLVAPERRRTWRCWPQAGHRPRTLAGRGAAQTVAFLDEHGPKTARQLGSGSSPAAPADHGGGHTVRPSCPRTAGCADPARFSGEILRVRPTGSWVNGAYRYVATEDWLPGGLAEVDERAAAADLADAGCGVRSGDDHRPAVVDGVDRWPAGALSDVGAVPVDLADGPGWLAADEPEHRPRSNPGSRCCPASTRRRWAGSNGPGICRPQPPRRSTAPATAARPSGWTDGSSAPGPRPRTVGCTPTTSSRSAPGAGAVVARAAELQSWVGETRFTVRFPGEIHARLLAGPAARRDSRTGRKVAPGDPSVLPDGKTLRERD